MSIVNEDVTLTATTKLNKPFSDKLRSGSFVSFLFHACLVSHFSFVMQMSKPRMVPQLYAGHLRVRKAPEDEVTLNKCFCQLRKTTFV